MLSADRLVERLSRLEGEAEAILRRAVRKGEDRTALVAVRELREQVEAIGRLAAVAALRQPTGPVTIVVDVSASGDDGPLSVPSATDDEEIF